MNTFLLKPEKNPLINNNYELICFGIAIFLNSKPCWWSKDNVTMKQELHLLQDHSGGKNYSWLLNNVRLGGPTPLYSKIHLQLLFLPYYRQQKFISHRSGGCKVQNRGTSRVSVWWKPTSWLTEGYLLAVSHMATESTYNLWLPKNLPTSSLVLTGSPTHNINSL